MEAQRTTVGVALNESFGAPRALLAARLQAVADAGLDHVGTTDHVSFHTGWGRDGLIDATTALCLQAELPVLTGIYQLPLRNPVLVARQLSAISELAPGRLTFGVGVGGEDRHEVEICGVDPTTRGRRMDESMAILQRLLSGQPVSFKGEFFELDDALIRPAPDPAVRFVVGGRSEAALRRAGELADGWLGAFVTPEGFVRAKAAIESHAAGAGRTDRAFEWGFSTWCGFGGEELLARSMERIYRLPYDRFTRYAPCGTPSEVAERLAPYAWAGCETFNIVPIAESIEEAVAACGELRRELLALTQSSAAAPR